MMSRSPDLVEVLRLAINNRLADLHVALPGRVESYDLANQAADIKPLIKRALLTSEDEEILEALPVIPSVPIVFPRAGGFFLTLPVKKGDLVTLLICERSIDKYTQGSGQDTDPVDLRMHSLIDAVAFPGFYPFSESLSDAHADNLVLGEDGGSQIHIKTNGQIHIGSESAAEFAAQAVKTLSRLQAIVTGFNTHTHPVPVGGSSGAPSVPLGAPASVAASKVKVD